MKSLEQELRTLLDWICVHWGFCTMSDNEWLSLTQSNRIEAREFAIAVLRANGFDPPEAELDWGRRLKARFIEHFGVAEVSENDFAVEKDSETQT